MANYIAQNFRYEKILFIPAYKPPHKDFDNATAIHRLNMVELAISDVKKFMFSDIEYRQETLSYTYLTIQELYKKYQIEEKIGFIIGEDAFLNIEKWYEAEKLKDLVHFLIFSRSKNFDKKIFANLYQKGYNYSIVDCEFTDISSSEIRLAIENSEPISDLVPKKVEKYIEKYELYKK